MEPIRGYDAWKLSEPPDERTPNQREYQDEMGRATQLETCLEYVEEVEGYDRLGEWLLERVKVLHPELILEYCEKLDSFWQWLD